MLGRVCEAKKLVTALLTNEFVSGCASQSKVDAYKEYDRERVCVIIFIGYICKISYISLSAVCVE